MSLKCPHLEDYTVALWETGRTFKSWGLVGRLQIIKDIRMKRMGESRPSLSPVSHQVSVFLPHTSHALL